MLLRIKRGNIHKPPRNYTQYRDKFEKMFSDHSPPPMPQSNFLQEQMNTKKISELTPSSSNLNSFLSSLTSKGCDYKGIAWGRFWGVIELFYILIVMVVTGTCAYVNIHRNVYLLPPLPAPKEFYCMIIQNKTKSQAPLAVSFILLPLLKCRSFTYPCLIYLISSLDSSFIYSFTHSAVFIGNFLWMKCCAWFWELRDE